MADAEEGERAQHHVSRGATVAAAMVGSRGTAATEGLKAAAMTETGEGGTMTMI